jgi:hypothetical protein
MIIISLMYVLIEPFAPWMPCDLMIPPDSGYY